MKLSQITTEQIKLLSDEQLNSIVFDGEGADNVTDGGCASATPRETLLSEAELMHGLIEHGLIEDIEY